MNKLLLSLTGLLPLVTIPLAIKYPASNLYQDKKNDINLENLIEQKNIAESNIDYNVKTMQRYNPTYPSFSKNMNHYGKDRRTLLRRESYSGGVGSIPNNSYDWYKVIGKGGRDQFMGQGWIDALSINVLDYAPSKSEFLKNFKNITTSFYYGVDLYSGGWKHGRGASMGTPNYKTYTYKLTSSNNVNGEEIYYEGYSKNEKARIYIGHEWSGNTLKIKLKGEVMIAWAGGSTVGHGAYVGMDFRTIKFNSTFNQNSLKDQVNKALSEPFEIKSDTSPNISSTELNGKPGNQSKSNKELIEDEITKRLKKSFGIDYDAWFSGSNSILKINTTYDDKNSIASITLKDESKISGGEQFVTNVKMPIKVNLTDYYYQKEAQKRLQIVPGQIVNPNSLENQLIKDNPAYDPKTNAFTYHNSVDVTFTGINGKEIMYVNGEEVPVYENVYRARLNDNRDGNGKGNNEYKIVVKGVKDPETGNETELKLNVNIDSLSKDLNYRWLGWNPEIYPDQKKLITPFNEDGTENLAYDKTINPDTGMRNQYVFVNDKNNKYPFFIDPLDKWGNIIKESDSNKKEKSFNGYIAEAYVANSGVALLNKFDMNNVAKIERVKLNPSDFNEIGQVENIIPNPNEQFSMPGLWHYIIYLNDYVDQEIDPSNPGTTEIHPKSGSTLHKLIYISKDAKDYTSFLNLDEIKQNKNILEFWSSIPGKHLKNYLVAYTEVNTSSKISTLTYEELILYWKQYVSDQFQQKVEVPPDPVNYKDLNDLEISTLKMNETNPVDVQRKIREHVEKSMKKFSPNAEYGLDYEIIDSNNVNLNNIDWKDFINIEEESKEMKLTIKSIPTSTLLNNEKTFLSINNKDYDETKALDLSTIQLKPIEYNFTSAPDDVKETFVQNYIFNYVTKILEVYRPENTDWEYIYGEDYYISINGLYGEDIAKDININKIIDQFLNSKEITNLEVTIISIDQSIKLTNYTSYLIINNPESDEIAPPEPPNPQKPEPENPDPNSKKVSSFAWWIILIMLSIFIIFILIILIIWKRKKVKKVK